MQTKVGDVLILKTTRTFQIYAIGAVEMDGQDDFSRPQDVQYVGTYDDALRRARPLLVADRCAYLLDIDTGQSREISDELEPRVATSREDRLSDSASL